MLHKLCIFSFLDINRQYTLYKLSISKIIRGEIMKNKKTLTKVALTTGLALTAVAPYGVGHAEETNRTTSSNSGGIVPFG